MTIDRWQRVAWYGLPGVLVGLALAWGGGGDRAPRAWADAAPRVDPSGSGTLAFTTPGPGAVQWLYLVDTRNQSFAVYRVDPQNAKGVVKLEAARHYRFDMKLSQYNNQAPEVADIQAMVQPPR